MAGNYTSLALVNLSPRGLPEPDTELGELIERASDVIVVLDLDEVDEGLVVSAIDGEYGEALPLGLAQRINSWASHHEEDERLSTNERLERIERALGL